MAIEHLDISGSGLVVKPAGSGNFLENSGSGLLRRSGAAGAGSLVLDPNGNLTVSNYVGGPTRSNDYLISYTNSAGPVFGRVNTDTLTFTNDDVPTVSGNASGQDVAENSRYVLGCTNVLLSNTHHHLWDKELNQSSTFPLSPSGNVTGLIGNTIEFSPDGAYVGYGTSTTGDIYRVVDMDTRTLVSVPPNSGGGLCRCIAFSPDSSRMLVGDYLIGTGRVTVLNTATWQVDTTWPSNTGFSQLITGAFSPDGQYLLIAGTGTSVNTILIRVSDRSVVYSAKVGTGSVYNIDWNSESTKVAISTTVAPRFDILDVPSLTLLSSSTTLPTISQLPWDIVFDADETNLFTSASNSPRFYKYNIATNTLTSFDIPGVSSTVYAMRMRVV